IDWTLLAPLLAHIVVTHVAVLVVRVTVTYRTIELGLPPLWLGIIAASFGLIPVFPALGIGRYIDRGPGPHAAWIWSALMLVAAVALWLWPSSAIHLLAFTILLGAGHMFLMAAQQMLCVRSASEHGREVAFGHYMVAVSIGQGLGPLLVGWVGGGVAVPAAAPPFPLGVLVGAPRGGGPPARPPAPRSGRRRDRPRAATHPRCGSPSCCDGRACRPFWSRAWSR